MKLLSPMIKYVIVVFIIQGESVIFTWLCKIYLDIPDRRRENHHHHPSDGQGQSDLYTGMKN